MDWKELQLSDRDLINSYFQNKSSEASELTFTNLFLWRLGSRISYKIIDDFLVIKHLNEMQEPLIFAPFGTGDPTNVINQLIDEWNKAFYPLLMTPISLDIVNSIMNSMPGKFDYFPEVDHSDYIYSIQDLIKLPGRKFHDKKNMMNRFMRYNQYEYLPITDNIIGDVMAAVEEWCELRNCEDSIDLEHEREGINECLVNFNSLDCEGGAIRVHDKIVAFTFGEVLTKDTVVIHIEKADPRLPGSYQIINQQFLEHCWPDYKWVNREGDMGIEGLRKAKMSYNPARMVEKFCLRQLR